MTLNANEGAFSAILTAILVIITVVYVIITNKLSNFAQKQNELMREQVALENRPWVYFSMSVKDEKCDITFENCGKQPAEIDSFVWNINNEKTIKYIFIRKSLAIPDRINRGLIVFLNFTNVSHLPMRPYFSFTAKRKIMEKRKRHRRTK